MFVCLVFSGVAPVACSETGAPSCPEGTDRFVEYQLFMGRGGQGGEVVDDASWEAFLEDAVTPRFPDGLTVVDAQGQWRGSEGTIEKERSKLLIVLAPPGDDGMRLIDEISYEYERRFDQESVLRVVDDACVSFSRNRTLPVSRQPEETSQTENVEGLVETGESRTPRPEEAPTEYATGLSGDLVSRPPASTG